MVLRNEPSCPRRQLGIPPTAALSVLLCVACKSTAAFLCKACDSDFPGLLLLLQDPHLLVELAKLAELQCASLPMCASLHKHAAEGGCRV